MTVFLRGSLPLFGTLQIRLFEVLSTGQQKTVTGASIDAPVALDTRILPFNLGVGIIDYQFQSGSAIQLNVQVSVNGGLATPYLVWDDKDVPTSVTIPVIEPTQASFSYTAISTPFDKMFRIPTGDNHTKLNIVANVTDVLGVYRIANSSLTLTASNGTARQFPVALSSHGEYSNIYSSNVTLDRGSWQVSLGLLDESGTTYTFNDFVQVAPFYTVNFNSVDSSGNPLDNATILVSLGSKASWNVTTDASGSATLQLPSSEIVGMFNLTATWHNASTQPSTPLQVVGNSTLKIIVPVYDVTIQVVTSGLPIPNARVTLTQRGVTVARNTTDFDGKVKFSRTPQGNYNVSVSFLNSQTLTPLSVGENGVMQVSIPTPYRNETLISLLIIVASISLYVARRRGKLYPQTFAYFSNLTTGGLPNTCFTSITGNSGSGKSVLLESLAADHLTQGKTCIYIVNTEYPAKIREDMVSLGMPCKDAIESGKLLFIDSYSAIGGTNSKEDYSVSSHTDLTGLGMKISNCMEKLGPGTDVYVDSIMPLLTALRVDYLLNFLQSIAAKVKANDGKLCLTVGSAIEKTDMAKLEDASDCVIETQLQESGKGQRRRLRIKKLRGKPYIDRWTNIQIQTGKGIVFLTKAKPEAIS
jgi:KaiC/GvpD/RAD55 family RecA-like ATPase